MIMIEIRMIDGVDQSTNGDLDPPSNHRKLIDDQMDKRL